MRMLIGLPAAKAYTELVRRLPGVAAMALVEQQPPPPAQARTPLRPADQELLVRAIARKHAVGLPFWDAVMLTIIEEGAYQTAVLEAALHHRSHRGRERWLSRDEIVAGGFEVATARPSPGTSVSLLSEVRGPSSETSHLPMLDFHCPVGVENLRVVATVAAHLLPAGLIVDSGHSYHLVGAETLTTDKLVDFLARASLFGAIVDRAYIAHQLIERRCALRLSRGGHAGVEPQVALAF